MKILHVITSLNIGGAEKLLVDLLPRFTEKGIIVELAVFAKKETSFSKALEAAGIKIHWLNNGTNPYNIINLFRLKKLIKEFDIIHAHNSICQLFTAISSIGSNKKFVTTEHSTSNRRRKMSYYRSIDRWMYSRYDRIICISKKAEDYLRKHINASDDVRIITINNGIDVKRFEDAIPDISIRKNLPPDSKIITMVSSMRDAKDQDTVIRALSFLPQNFYFLMVGDGPRRNNLLELAKQINVDNRVKFLGIRSDIPDVLKSSDIAIMSSHWEGLSLSSVEGMSVGIPFLASDVDGLREVVGGAGLLFPHQNAEALAQIILSMTNNNQLYKKVSKACLDRARTFDISKTVSMYINTYKSII